MTSAICQQVRAELPWFVGDELDHGRVPAVREHLRDCMACRREAAALQQSLGALRSGAAAAAARVDDAMFTDLHHSILARVEAAEAAEGTMAPNGRRAAPRWLLTAAAAALVAVGFWFGMGRGGDDIWGRPATQTSMPADGRVMVVPYAGPRVELRPLGNEYAPEPDAAERGDAGATGSGLLVRRWLRTLVEEGAPLPPPVPPQAAPVSAPR